MIMLLKTIRLKLHVKELIVLLSQSIVVRERVEVRYKKMLEVK